ncbi:MAG: hypothetical protein KJN94_08570, partial [Gammaproteobacteria bacterium]|nr:hypothetical protein [Gammaproteobacteria bacterium]
ADGRMTAVVVQCMQLGEPGPSGRRRPVPIEGETFTQAADTLVAAIAQVPVLAGLESLDHDGNWLVTDSSGHLSDTVLAGGDAIHPGIAGEAIVQGRRAAEDLHAALSGRVAGRAPDPDVPDISAEQVLFATKPQIGAVQAETLPGPKRVEHGMAEVASTIGADEFLAEVERCFSCGSCSGCEACYMYCTAGCFTRVEEARPGVYFTLNLDQCEECGKCIEVCPGGYLEAT